MVTETSTLEASFKHMLDAETDRLKHGPAARPAPAAPDPGRAAAEVEPERLEAAVEVLRQRVGQLRTSVQFDIDTDLNRTVIKVIDTEKDETILQIPPQHALEMARFFAGEESAGGDQRPTPGLLIRELA